MGKALGDCYISCQDVFESMEQGDAFGIGLAVDRPEAAIADPSRLIIRDVVPTYATSESFLESAKFKLSNQNNQDVHGGFKNQDQKQAEPEVMMGVGREKLNGMMPLFLFDEHWAIAKRKMAPILGFMCTTDIMGYTAEQQAVIPFLVFMKALQKYRENPTEANERMLFFIEVTCIKILEQNKKLTNQLAE